MYLSRLLLNAHSRQVQRETADPYNLHRTILKAFDAKRSDANVLHRIEVNGRSGAIMLLVQSQTEPNWQPLIDKTYLVPPEPFSGFTNPAVKQVDLSLNNGQQLRFR
ncbi:MAG: type I-E CRISPR-associated protein Cas6/Cse3/CasE, partial [Chloroflexi bacterium]|nr:type I-E CRISPR-associated protein Cas6/Cse3/CasE [Chloroflexota bacterium]